MKAALGPNSLERASQAIHDGEDRLRIAKAAGQGNGLLPVHIGIGMHGDAAIGQVRFLRRRGLPCIVHAADRERCLRIQKGRHAGIRPQHAGHRQGHAERQAGTEVDFACGRRKAELLVSASWFWDGGWGVHGCWSGVGKTYPDGWKMCSHAWETPRCDWRMPMCRTSPQPGHGSRTGTKKPSRWTAGNPRVSGLRKWCG